MKKMFAVLLALLMLLGLTACQSGGGYGGATGGSVPAGTTITVTSAVTYSSSVYWEGSYSVGDNWNPGPKSFSYTVNSDCSFTCYGIVN